MSCHSYERRPFVLDGDGDPVGVCDTREALEVDIARPAGYVLYVVQAMS